MIPAAEISLKFPQESYLPEDFSPGAIQPFGALLAFEMATETVRHASANLGDFLTSAKPGRVPVGDPATALLPSNVIHALRNFSVLPSMEWRAEHLGSFNGAAGPLEARAHSSDGTMIVEITNASPEEPSAADVLKDFAHLHDRIRDASDPSQLLNRCVGLLRTISGYDRVAVTRLSGGSGEVVAESRKSSVPAFLGARFDAPGQPPLAPRLIVDASDPPVAVTTLFRIEPLNMPLGLLRAPEDRCRAAMREAEIAAMLTLPLTVGGSLWGQVVFHHRRARQPAARVNQILRAFLPVLCLSLELRLRR